MLISSKSCPRGVEGVGKCFDESIPESRGLGSRVFDLAALTANSKRGGFSCAGAVWQREGRRFASNEKSDDTLGSDPEVEGFPS